MYSTRKLVKGRTVALLGGGPFEDSDLTEHNCDLLATVNGSSAGSNSLGMKPDIVFIDEWLLKSSSDRALESEREKRLSHLRDHLLMDAIFVLVRSQPRTAPLKPQAVPWLSIRPPERVGVSKARRAAISTLKDLRIGSFPHFRMSTGMTSAILLLHWGASSVKLIGFDPLVSPSFSGEGNRHVLADCYAVALEATQSKRLLPVSDTLQRLQQNWAGRQPVWAKRSIKNNLYFSGVFWW